MKKTSKKLLSLVLAIVMVVALFPLEIFAAGNSISTATDISLGYNYSGEISTANKYDYYKFTLSQSGSLNITASAMVNLYYRIYDTSNTSSAIWSTSHSGDMNTTLELCAGTYYFKVEYGGYGAYSFKLSFTSANESFAETIGGSNNTLSTASSITLGTTYRGHIGINDKNDYYKFTLSQSGSLNITASAMVNLYYRIYDTSNTSSAIWSTSTSGVLNKTIQLSAGTYYFKVEYGGYGAYSFNLSYIPQDTKNPSCAISTTKNIESSQTVSLELYDNIGIAGYYWGTNSNYSSNTYTSISKAPQNTTISKTISNSGTYYLTAKDTKGNISTTVSITFYKIALNANGGSVSPSYILAPKGYSFTFPIPSKTNNKYMGWEISQSETSGIYTLYPTENATYYAIWSSDIINPTASIQSKDEIDTYRKRIVQNVTLELRDNEKIRGYFWGTSATYTDNTYINVKYDWFDSDPTLKRETIIVSDPGTYYLNVVDNSGNISQTYSITFFRTSLDANGGNVSVSYIITEKGNICNFPKPDDREGYKFIGWALSPTATSGAISHYPTENSKYYAIWKEHPKLEISLSKTDEKLVIGETLTIIPTTTPDGQAVTWSTTNINIAEVSNGTITAKNVGTATITASFIYDGELCQGICTITVECHHANTTIYHAEDSTCLMQGHNEYTICNDCGEVINGSDELLPIGNHSGGNATCKEQAICVVCHQPYGEYASHDLTHHIRIEADHFKAGNIEYWTCNVCGKHFSDSECKTEISEKDTVISKIEHSYSNIWSFDYLKHWKECSCGDKISEETHAFDNACDTDCNICGYVRRIIHNYDEEWLFDEIYHWHECNCCGDVTQKAYHTWDKGTVTKAPTIESEGVIVYKCTVCGKERTEILEKITYVRGDVDNNGSVNSTDAIYLLRHIMRASKYPINQNGDMDGDGEINSSDAIYLLRYTMRPSKYPLS